MEKVFEIYRDWRKKHAWIVAMYASTITVCTARTVDVSWNAYIHLHHTV